MKSIKIFCLIVVVIINTQKTFSQENEVGAWLGSTVYQGDLNPTMSFKNARWGAGVFFRYNLNNRMAVKAGFNYGFLDAADKRIKRFPYLQARNLDFKSQIAEVAVTYEINFFKYSTFERNTKRWTPYLFAGLSMFYFSPYTKYDGIKYRLESIGTEGQKTPNRLSKNRGYNSYSFSIPYGGGFKIAVTQNWAVNVEVSSRLTFTDYIDDVSGSYADPEDVNYFVNDVNIGNSIADKSNPKIGVPGKQRGTSNDKDRFLMLGVGITYTFINLKCPKVF
jgi:hypothetical protein